MPHDFLDDFFVFIETQLTLLFLQVSVDPRKPLLSSSFDVQLVVSTVLEAILLEMELALDVDSFRA